MSERYAEAFDEFKKLPHVDDDQLDGSIWHLVFRAQHEVDMYEEEENVDITYRDVCKLQAFILKWRGIV